MKFRKKPVVIEAEQFNGDAAQAARLGAEWRDKRGNMPAAGWYIDTLEGAMRCDVGCWIITGVEGERYPCKNEIFAATYEQVVE